MSQAETLLTLKQLTLDLQEALRQKPVDRKQDDLDDNPIAKRIALALIRHRSK